MIPSFRFALLLATTCVPFTTLSAQALDTLKDTTERWISTRSRLAEEQAKWETEKSLILSTLETLRSTQESLSDSVAVLELDTKKLNEETDTANAKLESFSEANAVILERIVQYEKRIQALAKRLPSPLLDEINPLLRKIPTGQSDSTPAPNRLQNIVAIATIIDEFNNNLTLSNTIKTLDDGEAIQVRVLYWGLATAYASNADGSKAWILKPAEGEWTWEPALEQASAVFELFQVYDKTIDPVMVEVPFTFQEKEGEQ